MIFQGLVKLARSTTTGSKRTRSKWTPVGKTAKKRKVGKKTKKGTKVKGGEEMSEQGSSVHRGKNEEECGKPTVGDKTGVLVCDLCTNWYHPSCQDLLEETYKVLKDSELVWLCSYCRECFPNLRIMMGTESSGKHEDQPVAAKLTNILEGQAEQQKKLEETVLSSTARMENTIEATTKQAMQSTINKVEDIIARSSHKIAEEMSNKVDSVTEMYLCKLAGAEKAAGNSITYVNRAAEENQHAAKSLPKITEEMRNTTNKVVKMMESQAKQGRKRTYCYTT